jgi:hypothetical protein
MNMVIRIGGRALCFSLGHAGTIDYRSAYLVKQVQSICMGNLAFFRNHMPLYDLRIATRNLLRSPGFTLTAVLMLAFGIGATTTVFSVVECVILRPLPFPNSDRLVRLNDVIQGADVGGNGETCVLVAESPFLRTGLEKRNKYVLIRKIQDPPPDLVTITLVNTNGADVATTQALMRHANASITMDKYVQAVTPANRQA